MRLIRWIALFLVIIPALLLGLEAAYFIWVLNGRADLQPVDVVVAFEGRPERVKAAFKLIESGLAPGLIISPASEKRLQNFEKKFNPGRPFASILEDQARTTFENALYTSRLAAENNFRSVILVTSWNHMPRALFLITAMGRGSGVVVQPHAVPTGKLSEANWHHHRLAWKMLYNEMVELWGSLIELARYHLTGGLLPEAPGHSPWAARLKQLLLFQIDERALHPSADRAD